MEGKNVEENKARDKWCSLCVSCGERPRLINRRIDTRYIRRKGKKKGKEREKEKPKTGGLFLLRSEKKNAIVNLSVMTSDRSRARVCVTNFSLSLPHFSALLALVYSHPRHARHFSEPTRRRLATVTND